MKLRMGSVTLGGDWRGGGGGGGDAHLAGRSLIELNKGIT